jgi:hypothetical protein
MARWQGRRCHLAGAGYGLITRFFFDPRLGNDTWLTMTCAFLLVGPFALGYLTVWLSPAPLQASGAYSFWAPWLASPLLFIAVLSTQLEILICLVMAAPIFFLLAGERFLPLSDYPEWRKVPAFRHGDVEPPPKAG